MEKINDLETLRCFLKEQKNRGKKVNLITRYHSGKEKRDEFFIRYAEITSNKKVVPIFIKVDIEIVCELHDLRYLSLPFVNKKLFFDEETKEEYRQSTTFINDLFLEG